MVQNPKGGGLSSTFGGNVNTISKFAIDTNRTGSTPEDKVIEMNNELPASSVPTKTVEKPVEKSATDTKK